MVAEQVTATSGVVADSVPSELAGWIRLVQRKVESVWAIPAGILMDADENVAEVSFWVNSDGRLLGTPTVTMHAADRALGESGVNAIRLADPFPPLPEGYPHQEQMVVYAFRLRQ